MTAFTSASMASISSAVSGAAVAEVEAHALAVDQLALLRHVRAQHVPQRRVHQVGGGVVGAGARAPFGVDDELHALAWREPALEDLQHVHVQVAGLLSAYRAPRPGRPARSRSPRSPAWPPLSA